MSDAQYQRGNGQSGAVVHAGTAVATTKAKPPSEVLRGQLVAMTGEFRNALPSHIKPEKFQRVIMTVVQQTPDLLTADRRSLLAACTKCAADGLIPDGREAALVLFSGKAQYMPMLAGIQKRARNSGQISAISSHVIYENDEFLWEQGTEEKLTHKPLWPGDRGKAVGAYAVAKFKDGSAPQFEVMTVAEIEKVRAVSRAKNNGPWVQWWDEMARKTVFRRLAKWLPMDAEADELIRRDDENEVAEPAEPTSLTIDGETGEVVASKLDAIEAAAEIPHTAA